MARLSYNTRRGNHPIHWTVLACVFLCTSLVAAIADPATQPAHPATASADQPFPAMRKWFAELSNPDAEIRNQAMIALMGLRTDDLPALRRLVQENLPLEPEQATRIQQIATHVFLAGDPYDAAQIPGKEPAESGFLGIHLPSQLDVDDPAIVIDPLPGFIGARLLRNGDVILGIREYPQKPIRHSSELTSALKDVPAGERLHFQVLREGRILSIAISMDPRPIEAAQADPESMLRFTLRRAARAQEFWQKNFADLLED